MKKIEDNITIQNYNEYTLLTYEPSFLSSVKHRVKILNAILKLNVINVDSNVSKHRVEFVDDNQSVYLIDEFTLLSNQKEFHIDITDELSRWNDSSNMTLTFKIYGVSLDSINNKVILEYENIKKLFDKQASQTFNIERAGNLNLNLGTGLYNLSHSDLSICSKSFQVNVNHYYESINAQKSNDFVILENDMKILPNYYCGMGWKTNFHQYLIKEKKKDELLSDSESSGKFTYIDGKGNNIIFEEKYYYLKDGVRKYVHYSDVSINLERELLIKIDDKEYKVFRETSHEHLTLNGSIDQFKGIEYIQTDVDEIVNLKANIKALNETILEYERNIEYNNDTLEMLEISNNINNLNVNIRNRSLDSENRELEAQYTSRLDQFNSDLPPNNIESEAQLAYYRAKNENYFALWGKYYDPDGFQFVGDGTKEGIMYNRKKSYETNLIIGELNDEYNLDSYTIQKNKLTLDNETLRNKIEELNITLIQKEYELETLQRQVPMYAISNESGETLGFGKTDDETLFRLIFILDSHGNIVYLNYKNDKISSITDEEKTLINFYYNDDGLLKEIIDINSKRVSFKYKENLAGNKVLLCEIKYYDNTSSYYYYDSDDNLSYIINPSGYGYGLNYENSKLTNIKDISVTSRLKKNNIEKVEHGDVIPNTSIKYALKEELKFEYSDYKHTILTNLMTNKSISYIFDKFGDIVTVFENKFENGSIIGNVNVTSYDKSNDRTYFVIKSKPYSSNYLLGSNFNNTIMSEYILGEDILCGDEIYLSSFIHEEGNGEKNNVYILNNENPIISKFLTKESIDQIKDSHITDLILSGCAKADSAWVERRCTDYNKSQVDSDLNTNPILNDNDYYRNSRRFELRAQLTYKHKVDENTFEDYVEVQYCSFDWMNTEWQYCAFPVTIKDDENYELESIEVYFDYSNNAGEAQFTSMELKKGNWEYYECDEKSNVIYYENGETDKKITYEYSGNKLIKEIIVNNGKEYVNSYDYNNNGLLIRKKYHNGLIEENVYDKDGKKIKSYDYHIDNPTQKIYKMDVISDKNGDVSYAYDVFGNKSVEYKYKDNSNLVVEEKDMFGNVISYGYSLDERLLNSFSSNISGKCNYNKMYYTGDILTGLSHNDFEFDFVYNDAGDIIEVYVGNQLLTSSDVEKILDRQLQDSGEYLNVVVGTKITKTLGTDEIFVIYKDLMEVVYRIEYYKNKNSDLEVLLNIKTDSFGNVVLSHDETTGIEYNYTYNEDGNPETVRYTQNGKEVSITYIKEKNKDKKKIVIGDLIKEDKILFDENDEDLLKEIQLSNGTIIEQKLDALNRLKTMSVGNIERNFDYLQIGDRLTNLISDEWYINKSEKISGSYVRKENISYKYDNAGNITEIRENGKLKAKYEYDSISRLIREDNCEFNKTKIYQYDIGGNIIRRDEFPFTYEKTNNLYGGNSYEYLYKNDGWKDQLLSYNGEVFEYDNIGNPVIYRNNILKWTRGNLLCTYLDNSKNETYEYEYNCNGDRISKTVKGKKTNFYLDESRIIAQDDGNFLYFHYGIDGVTGFTYEGVGDYLYKKNINGDIIGIYDSTETLIVKYEYDAWGNHKTKLLVNNLYVDLDELEETNTIIENYKLIANINPFRYRGYYFDSEINLYYLNSRYYDPQIGRFINADDISVLLSAKDEFNGLNLYAYCFNNPINDSDPNGNLSWKKAKKVFKKVAQAVVVVVAVTAAVAGGAALIAAAVGAAALIPAIVSATIAGGLIAGGFSIVGQGLSKGFSNIDLKDVAIDAFSGAAYGAIAGAIGPGASLGTKILGGVGRVAISGITTALHGINQGLSKSNIISNVTSAMITSSLVQIAFIGGPEILSKKFPGGGKLSGNKVVEFVTNIINDPVKKTSVVQGLLGLDHLISGDYNY